MIFNITVKHIHRLKHIWKGKMQLLCYLVIGYFAVIFVFRLFALVLMFLFTGVLVRFRSVSSWENNDIPAEKPVPSTGLRSTIKRILDGMSIYVSHLIGSLPSHVLRRILYRTVLHVKMGEKVVIYKGCEMRASYKIHIGKGTIVGNDCILAAQRGITLGENVNIGYGVWIWAGQHDIHDPYFSTEAKGSRGPVAVGNRVWLGARTIILGGVTIGEGAVIASGAVVTRDVEPFSIYGGIPARKIGERNRDLLYEFDGKPLFFI